MVKKVSFCPCIYMYIIYRHTHIYRGRERKRGREGERERGREGERERGREERGDGARARERASTISTEVTHLYSL